MNEQANDMERLEAEIAALRGVNAALVGRQVEAWDVGYACGLGDCGKQAGRDTFAANPYGEVSRRPNCCCDMTTARLVVCRAHRNAHVRLTEEE